MRGAGPPPSEVVLEIEALAAGGDGLGRLDGKVVFARGGLPGDTVRVKLEESHKRYARGAVVELMSPSFERRESPCPIACLCGGCPWMALPEMEQLRAKQRILEDQLERIGGISRERVKKILPSERSLGYRNRLRLISEGDRIGFRRHGSRQLVDVESCAVALPSLNTLLLQIRQMMSPHLPLETSLRIELQEAADGSLELGVAGRQAQLLSGLGSSESTDGTLELRIDSSPIRDRAPSLLSFSQANHQQNERLLEAVRDGLELRPGQRLLDLFAGSGNFSLPLALELSPALSAEPESLVSAGAESEPYVVVGVESDPRAVQAANRRAPANARYLHGDCVEVVERLISRGERFARVILDPPRAGARDLCVLLPRLGAARMVYVSCDPATLARDLKRLVAQGYEVEKILPVDMMPQTAHIESVTVLVKSV